MISALQNYCKYFMNLLYITEVDYAFYKLIYLCLPEIIYYLHVLSAIIIFRYLIIVSYFMFMYIIFAQEKKKGIMYIKK